MMLRNEGGILSAVPLLPASLSAATPNGVRKLYQLNRTDTIAALMHDAVLVPEGRIDYEWMKLLVRVVDLSQGWTQTEESRFGAYIGLVPTHDAAVQTTIEALTGLHPRITALVDGDKAGQNYAAGLIGASLRPAVIVRWPDGWMVEDVVGWILDADPAQALQAVKAMITPAPVSIADLVARLKSGDRTTGGLKQDHVAYEAVADVIGTHKPCCQRARELLNGLSDVLLGGANPRFEVVLPAEANLRIFRP